MSALNRVKQTEKQKGINHHTLQDKGYAYGGTVLHELYFAGLSSSFKQQLNYNSPLRKAIDSEYGTHESLIHNLKQAGKSSRGWVICGLNLFSQCLDVYGLDAHHEGSNLTWIWPIIVMDVYEHAYMIDHGTNKGAYLEEFVGNIDWQVAEKRFLEGLKVLKGISLISI